MPDPEHRVERPSQLLKPLFAKADEIHRKGSVSHKTYDEYDTASLIARDKLFDYIDSHAARLESLERDRERQNLRPAIATRWPDPSPQSDWPSETVKVWSDKAEIWHLRADGSILHGWLKPESQLFPSSRTQTWLDANMPVIYTRPSPPVQSEQAGKPEGYYKAPGGHWYRCDLETTDYCLFVKCDPPKGVPG